MRATIIACFCISFLSSTIQCVPDRYTQAVINGINERAEANETIKDVFRPSLNGCLGVGGFGFTYKGILIKPDRSEKEVAMKFTKKACEREAAKEYRMYTYLNAINNEHVEQYGIPSVHYFGKWLTFYLMAITLLDTSMASQNDRIEELDGLIMFRDFVKASKYIHGCGICQDDIKPDNIMFRRSNAFIIDYNLAKIFGENGMDGTLKYKSIAAHLNAQRSPKDDWESFFYSMFRMLGVKLDWFGRLPKINQRDFVLSSKLNKDNIIHKIDGIPFEGLKIVLHEFSNHVYSDNPIPAYDDVYDLINRLIASTSSQQPALVSFIKNEDRQLAISESSTIFNISSIVGPSENPTPNYPSVDYDFFYKMYSQDGSLRALSAYFRS